MTKKTKKPFKTPLLLGLLFLAISTPFVVVASMRENINQAQAEIISSNKISTATWVASASSSSPTDPVQNAIDNNISTRWSAGQAQTNGQWFQIDMGSSQQFNSITMDTGSSNQDYPQGYSVFISQDGQNWGRVLTTGNGNGHGQQSSIKFPLQTARYLKIVQTGTSVNWWSVAELTVSNEPVSALNPIGIPGVWNLNFNDEFDGSNIDTNKWYLSSAAQNGGLQCYEPGQVSVSGGYLHLLLEQRTSTCTGTTREYVSGSINSKYTFTYGAFEARMYVPGTQDGKVANWPAWWTVAWPAVGEIDVVEGLSGDSCWSVHPELKDPGGCVSPTIGWHTFGAEWKVGSVDFYYDGLKVGTAQNYTPTNPNYAVLDNALASWSGTPVVPSDLQVDYVRIWSATNPTSTPTPTPTAIPTLTPTPTASSVGVNLLKNPSFESGLSSWTFVSSNSKSNKASVTTSTKVDGLQSALVSIAAASPTLWAIQLEQGNLSLIAGKTYTISFWAKASNNRTIDIVTQQQGGNWIQYYQVTPSLTTAWTKYTYSFKAPATAISSFVFNLAKTTGSVWIDGVSLTAK